MAVLDNGEVTGHIHLYMLTMMKQRKTNLISNSVWNEFVFTLDLNDDSLKNGPGVWVETV